VAENENDHSAINNSGVPMIDNGDSVDQEELAKVSSDNNIPHDIQEAADII